MVGIYPTNHPAFSTTVSLYPNYFHGLWHVFLRIPLHDPPEKLNEI
jgi:hypothetical protein